MILSCLILFLLIYQILSKDNVSVFDVSDSRLDWIGTQYGIHVTDSVEDCVVDADLIVIAVKPQNCEVVFKELCPLKPKGLVKNSATLLSIVAGLPIHKFVSGTGIKKVARSMPNTPATIGKGVTVFTTQGIDDEERNNVKEILCSFGKTVSL